ncbi:serine hydrolase [Actinorhabdospora filicis]|uniref:Serine hydrolase n=1 Tax=Actinorhabdospora filicis TaxID=1785913 RepID=A0A9W6W6Q8_9ACTN|nr:serine hydrolase domain-containing protein [Actinorhabdospora filicis]GLZ75799.1 serine hydrolase [Actinorhabdospora filicis]
MSTPIAGYTAPGYEPVREAFAEALDAEPGNQNAHLAAYAHGRLVADLWNGPDGDALTGLYSVAKGVTALVTALVVQDGRVDLDATVASYWPEFGQKALTVRQLLGHRSGLVGVPEGFTPAQLADDRVLAARLASAEPYWTPGDGYGYHAYVIGALVGEVVLRATGRTVREIYEERVRAPRGLDLFLGLPAREENRFTPMLPALGESGLPPRDSLIAVAFNLHTDPPADIQTFLNSREARAKGPASAGAVGNARGIAGVYAAAIGADGTEPLLRPETVAAFAEPYSTGIDLVTGEDHAFALGFEAQGLRYPGLSRHAFGHSGAAGAQGFADPGLGLAYGYSRSRFHFPPGGGAVENDGFVAALVEAAAREAG